MKDWNGEERRNVDWREVTDHMATTNKTLQALTDQVTKQNGRVTKLESNVDILKNWRSYILGIGGAIGGMLTCLGLLIAWVKH